MAHFVYLLCTLTSILCAVLLIRGYKQSGTRLLMWLSICFIGLAVNNILLFIDLVVRPELDLSISRDISGIAGGLLFLMGVLWDRAAKVT